MKVIIVGDTLSNGGFVLTGRQNPEIDLDLFASIEDKVICNIHGENNIAEGAPNATIDGRPIALEGHKASCGCILVASNKRILPVEMDLINLVNIKTE